MKQPKKKKKLLGMCPKCLRIRVLTKHHIHPQRHFTQKNPEYLFLCRDCHSELEKEIPHAKIRMSQYEEIARDFLMRDKGQENMASMTQA